MVLSLWQTAGAVGGVIKHIEIFAPVDNGDQYGETMANNASGHKVTSGPRIPLLSASLQAINDTCSVFGHYLQLSATVPENKTELLQKGRQETASEFLFIRKSEHTLACLLQATQPQTRPVSEPVASSTHTEQVESSRIWNQQCACSLKWAQRNMFVR